MNPRQPIEDIKNTFGLSDWELTDIYNSRHGSFRSAPLSIKLAGPTREAVVAHLREERIEREERAESRRRS